MERPEEEGDDLDEECRGHELCLRAVRAADRAHQRFSRKEQGPPDP